VNQIKVRTDPEDLEATPAAAYTRISDFAEITEIMRSRKFVQGMFAAARETIMRDTLIVLDGKEHLRRRNILNELFSEAAVADLRALHLVPAIRQCVDELAGMPRSGDGFVRADLVLLVQRCVYRIAAAVAGIDGLASAEIVDRMIGQVKAITAGFTVDWSKEPEGEVLERALRNQEQFRDELFEASQARRIEAVERHRRGEIAAADLPRDVLTYTILHKGDAWADDEGLRLREMTLFLSAASQTTANGFILFMLLLEDWLKEHPEDRALIGADPDFLRKAVFESLRVAATVPARLRVALEDVQLASGRAIRAGECVALLVIPANMANTAHFGADSDRYNPHREFGDVAPWGLTFGSGAHTCPGRPIVTGGRSMKAETGIDGSLVSMARILYGAGMEPDPERPPVLDPATHYNNYASVPVRFGSI
jgi:cytochrome P450